MMSVNTISGDLELWKLQEDELVMSLDEGA